MTVPTPNRTPTIVCKGRVVGLSCFADGQAWTSVEAEVRFLRQGAKAPEAMHIVAATAPQAFAGFVSIALFSYQCDEIVEVEARSEPGGTPIITRMTLTNKV